MWLMQFKLQLVNGSNLYLYNLMFISFNYYFRLYQFVSSNPKKCCNNYLGEEDNNPSFQPFKLNSIDNFDNHLTIINL
jgi:hypothetical protein